MGLFGDSKIKKMEKARDIDGLISALNDNDKNRRKAADALGKLGDKRAVEPLIQLLNDRNKKVRENAVLSLRELKVKELLNL